MYPSSPPSGRAPQIALVSHPEAGIQNALDRGMQSGPEQRIVLPMGNKLSCFNCRAGRRPAMTSRTLLSAADQCLGCRDPLHSGHIWIDTLESLEWPTQEHKKFFRRVTVLAVRQLFRYSADTSVSLARTSLDSCIRVEILEQESSLPNHSQKVKEPLCPN